MFCNKKIYLFVILTSQKNMFVTHFCSFLQFPDCKKEQIIHYLFSISNDAQINGPTPLASLSRIGSDI